VNVRQEKKRERACHPPTLYDFPAREYGQVSGRWTSPDPLGLRSVLPEDPQTLNRYAYVRNNPLALTDPTGLDGGGCDPFDPSCGGGCDPFDPTCGGFPGPGPTPVPPPPPPPTAASQSTCNPDSAGCGSATNCDPTDPVCSASNNCFAGELSCGGNLTTALPCAVTGSSLLATTPTPSEPCASVMAESVVAPGTMRKPLPTFSPLVLCLQHCTERTLELTSLCLLGSWGDWRPLAACEIAVKLQDSDCRATCYTQFPGTQGGSAGK
jgi:RHS repeat-associated protein